MTPLRYTDRQHAAVLARAMPPDARAMLLKRSFGKQRDGRGLLPMQRHEDAIAWLMDRRLIVDWSLGDRGRHRRAPPRRVSTAAQELGGMIGADKSPDIPGLMDAERAELKAASDAYQRGEDNGYPALRLEMKSRAKQRGKKNAA